MLSAYYEHLHSPGMYTSYSGFVPSHDYYGNECVGLKSSESVSIKFVLIDESLKMTYGGG